MYNFEAMNGAIAAVVLDKRVQRKDGRYAVKLRITHNRLQKYYPTTYHFSVDEWEQVQARNPRGERKEVKLYLNRIENKAASIIRDLVQFSFVNFEKVYNENEVRNEDVFILLEAYRERLIKENRLNSANTFTWTINSLKGYHTDKKTKRLLLSEVTPAFLQGYENWMLHNNKSISTVGIYLRNVRTILNEAIENGLMPRDAYPFGKRKYRIPASRNVKKALPLSQIKEIFHYQPRSLSEERARDLWLFTYLCNGINVKDIARLRNKNVTAGSITFLRSKSERSTRNDLKPIVVVMMPEIRAILDKWGKKSNQPNDFVFDMLDGKETPESEHGRIKQETKTINKYMKRIGIELGIETPLTTYVARHSFATVLKRSGASIQFISESLGHKNIKTTESYLDSFDHSQKTHFQNQLLNFE